MDDFLFLRVGYVSSLGGIDIDIDIYKYDIHIDIHQVKVTV